MKRVLFLFLFLASSIVAQAKTPSPASVAELLELEQIPAVVQNSFAEFPAMFRKLDAFQTTQEQQAAKAQALTEIEALLKRALSWERVKPRYIQLYQKTYTQTEVDALIKFYKTPIGASIASKNTQKASSLNHLYEDAVMQLMPQIILIQTKHAAKNLLK